MARASLGIVIAAMSTGCLITDPPQYTSRAHSAPILLEATASPALNRPHAFPTGSFQTFSAEVRSQDDPNDPTSGSHFQSVESWLLIDYGYNDPNQPYPYRQAWQGVPLAAGGTAEQTGRTVSIGWQVQGVAEGCHTATLMVSHWFDKPVSCPVCDDDFSSLTWQILVCNTGTCDSLPITGQQSCEGLTSSCADWRRDRADAGAPYTVCPEDGGAP